MSSISRFHLLLQSARELGDPELEAAMAQLLAETKEKLISASIADKEFFDQAVKAVRKVEGHKAALPRINSLLNACQYYYVTGQAFSAIEPANDAIALSRRIASPVLLRRSLNVLGIVSADTGDISHAIEHYAEALEVSRRLNDFEAESATWNNLGAAFYYAAQYQDALSCHSKVLDLHTQHPSLTGYAATAQSGIALCCLHLSDFQRGLEAAKNAIAISAEPRNATELLARVLRENNCARLLLEVHDLAQARERCELARRYAAASKSARAEIVASVISGLCDVYGGNVDIGMSRLEAALEKARLMPAMLRDALIAMVKANQLIGKPEKALGYLRELMEHTRQVQQKNALMHNTIHLQVLGKKVAEDLATSRTFEKHEAELREQVAQKELISAQANADAAHVEKDHARRELFRSRVEMLERMAVTAELRDDSTGEHSYRVGKLASLLAQEYGCDEETCFMIDIAGRLHDIGKIGVPDAVLLKPGPLNEAEKQVMRQHPVVGAELLSRSNTPQVQMAEEIARYHHERWDGKGYPAGIGGTAIPLSARITALADVFDALTHKRPYKEAWTIDDAMAEMTSQRGLQFDPDLTDLFANLVARLRSEHLDLDRYLGQAASSTPFLRARLKIQDALHRGHHLDDTSSGSRLDLQR